MSSGWSEATDQESFGAAEAVARGDCSTNPEELWLCQVRWSEATDEEGSG